MNIDFIAHHDIQFQSASGVHAILLKKYNCTALVGQACNPAGSEVGIMLDHSAFQPFVNKNSYKYLIHMCHDLADIEIYFNEKNNLNKYDLILVPGEAHLIAAKNALGTIPILPIGWPKLDNVISSINNYKDEKKTIIYAPSFIENREWVELLPVIIDTGFNILVKNHIYYDFENGRAPPKGSENEYQKSIESLLDMEDYIKKNNFQNVEYIDRRSNLCEIFNRAQLLITDSSSASIEFMPFGCSIETGRFPNPSIPAKPQTSALCKKVKFIPFAELKNILCNSEKMENLFEEVLLNRFCKNNDFIYNAPIESSRYAASLIDMFVQTWAKDQDIRFYHSNFFKRILGW